MSKFTFSTIRYTICLLLFFSTTTLLAQKKKHAKKQAKVPKQEVMSNAELDNYKLKVKQLVSFLEYSLNTIGNDTTFENEKAAIMNTSYLKIFQSDRVQIEDDLVEDRIVITNKNVKAYLQDVDYFFKNVKFELKIENISEDFNDQNRLFFVVTLTRHLKGITIADKEISNNIPRYIEINLDQKRNDLKIVSIYTHKLSEEEELKKWWAGLSKEWKNIFSKETGTDSVNYGSLKRLVSTEALDVSGNKDISNLEPLNKLIKLKRLNFSNTVISNLQPLRNLSHLESLAFNNTPVAELEPLKYYSDLKELYCDSTNISSLEVLRSFDQLEVFHFSKTSVINLEPIAGLKNLRDLKFSNNAISDITWLKDLDNLERLDFSNTMVSSIDSLGTLPKIVQLHMAHTPVSDLKPIENLKSLIVVNFSHTAVASLHALKNMPVLEKIYCDKSKVDQQEAIRFMYDHPGILVISGSEEALTWWNTLPDEWKNVFKKYIPSAETLSKEQLTSLINLETLDISGNDKIANLSPLRMLGNLKELRLNNTPVKNIAPLQDLGNLQQVEFSGTLVNTLDPLWNLKNLIKINCNNTRVDSSQIKRFIANHPACIVIYKTAKLTTWWNKLPAEWKTIFREHGRFKDSPAELMLHQLVRFDTIYINSKPITTLAPLFEFSHLKVLSISNTQVQDLSPIKNLKSLQKLECSNSPIKDLKPLAGLSNLEHINIVNTAVEDLSPMERLIQLDELICSGTQVKSLKPLYRILDLKYLDCSNTRVGNLNALKDLKKIKFLACYNTGISKRQVKKFTEDHPGSKVVYY